MQNGDSTLRLASILNNNLSEKRSFYGCFLCQEKVLDLIHNCIHYGLKRTDVFLFIELCARSGKSLHVSAPLATVAELMGYKEKTASDAMLRLRVADLIRKISGHEYMINPFYCLKSFKTKYAVYERFSQIEADPRSKKNSIRVKRAKLESDPFAYFGFKP